MKAGEGLDISEYEHEMTIYRNDIELYITEYIDNLSDQSLIYKTMAFNGLLHYLYMHVFKYKPDTVRYNNKNSIIDYNNTYLINDIINIYIDICFKYNHIPTILGFSVLTGIDNQTITSWVNGEYKSNSNIVNIAGFDKPLTHSETAKRLKAICEQALLSNTIENNSIGSIFALKANYGYSDQPQLAIEQKPDNDIVDISAITDKYRNSPVPKFEPIE